MDVCNVYYIIKSMYLSYLQISIHVNQIDVNEENVDILNKML